jgi:site-specific recombinase XerD
MTPAASTPARRNQLRTLEKSWSRYLRGGKEPKSEFTIRNYTRSLRALAAYLDAHGLAGDAEAKGKAPAPITVKRIQAEDIQAWLADIRARTSGNNANHHWRNITAFYAWQVEEERALPRTANPMLDVSELPGEEIDRTPYTDEQIEAMLKACSGTSFIDRRDQALIRVLVDTGVRVGGLTGMLYHPDHPETDNQRKNDVFLDHSPALLRFRLKGGKSHLVDISRRTVLALDRYLREREDHPHAGSPFLWVGAGADGEQLRVPGVEHMLRRRGKQAGIRSRVFPHRFRRTGAIVHLRNGGSERTLKSRYGWSSDTMVGLYVSASEQQLAWAESQELGLADRF